MSDVSGEVEKLTARLDDLERRLGALERRSAGDRSSAAPQPAAARSTSPSTLALSQAGAFSVLGRAMLGIAGAYVLRALMESSLAPKPLVAAVAIVYALLWLAAAARRSAETWFPRAAYACTSSLIFAPMLWELTLRFKVLPAWAAAGALAVFVGVAAGFTWKRPNAPVFWIANITAIALAIALAVASHYIEPFLAALLFIALLAEWSRESASERGVRVVAAVAADLMVWALMYIYSSPQTARADYPDLSRIALLAPGILLFIIYAGPAVFRTAFRAQPIRSGQAVQTTIAFLLAAAGILRFGSSLGASLLGILCLLLSATGYTAVFSLFRSLPDRRNHVVFGAWSAALLLAGLLLSLPSLWSIACLCVAALAASTVGALLSSLGLELHGLAFLASAAAASGLLRYDLRTLIGTIPGAPSFAVTLVSLFALLCYLTAPSRPRQSRIQQALHVVLAAIAAAAVMALLVQGFVAALTLGAQPQAHHLAFLRTLTLCLGALGMAFAGARLRRLELSRVAYSVLVLAAIKLIVEDLRHGHFEYVAASIFLFALTLIAVPRAARGRRQA